MTINQRSFEKIYIQKKSNRFRTKNTPPTSPGELGEDSAAFCFCFLTYVYDKNGEKKNAGLAR